MQKQGLDFSGREQPATLIMAVSVIIAHYGEEGCTSEDVAGTVQKNLPQWKPSSVSPSVSNLIKLGRVKAKSNFGVRRLYHVSDFDPDVDPGRISEIYRQIYEQRHPKTGVVAPRSAPPAAVPPGPMSILLAIGENKTEAFTVEEARQLYLQLHAMFGAK